MSERPSAEIRIGNCPYLGKNTVPTNTAISKKILKRAEEHPNLKYFIYKSIIVNNLYGVDIMEEAIEICKLRLFLKLVAQIESIEHIEPLPDIDFNIRAGNTLVGFATYEEAKTVVASKLDFDNTMDRIKEQAEDVDRLFKLFHKQQTELGGEVAPEDKQVLKDKLKVLEDELNQYLAGEYGIDPNKKTAYEKWLKSHHPFHWFIEFYGILKSGGFDVIIGNPPYVEYKSVTEQYRIRNFHTDTCGNLYAFVVEKSFNIAKHVGRIGLIVPISLMAAQRMSILQDLIISSSDYLTLANFGLRPAALFPGIMQRLTICIALKGIQGTIFTSDYITWYAEEREVLFSLLRYFPLSKLRQSYSIPKVNNSCAHSALVKILSKPRPWSHYNQFKGNHRLFYHNAGGYWIKTFDFKPYYKSLKHPDKNHTTISELNMPSSDLVTTYLGILNSSLFYFFWKSLTDARHVYPSDIVMLPIELPLKKTDLEAIDFLRASLMNAFKKNKKRITYGEAEVDQFTIAPSKTIIDEIDRVLAKHYGFTDEEIDFIINYDVKYRMGRENEEDG